MQDVGADLDRELLDARLHCSDLAQFRDAAARRRQDGGTVETQALDLLHQRLRLALLGRGQVEGLPAERAARGIAAVRKV